MWQPSRHEWNPSPDVLEWYSRRELQLAQDWEEWTSSEDMEQDLRFEEDEY